MPTKPKKVTNQKVMGTKSILRKALPIDSLFCFVFVLFLFFVSFSIFVSIFFFFSHAIVLPILCRSLSLNFHTSLQSICATRGRWGMDCGNYSCTSRLILLSNTPYCLHHLNRIFFFFVLQLILSITYQC